MDRNIIEMNRSVFGFGHGHSLDYELRLFQHWIKYSVAPACLIFPPRRSRWELHFGGIMAGIRHHKFMEHKTLHATDVGRIHSRPVAGTGILSAPECGCAVLCISKQGSTEAIMQMSAGKELLKPCDWLMCHPHSSADINLSVQSLQETHDLVGTVTRRGSITESTVVNI
jgi:hypothetical protein